MRRFGFLLWLKLNPRNFRVSGRATALLASFTLSFSRREEAGDAIHHPLSCPLAADVNIAVIRIPHEAMLTPFEFAVEFIEDDIRQERRERSTLRCAFFRRTHQPVLQHTHFQDRPDQSEHSLVGYPPIDRFNQVVGIDPIKEFLKIEIYPPAMACGDVLLRLGYRLMRRAFRPEPVTVFGERRVPSALQYLHHRLLDQPIHTVGMPSFRTPPSGFGIATRRTGCGS